ncbi:MAG: hypothetical protein KA149_03450 [Chitinophagales bacterium]|nr:hypothetical protein [Chitinophagales bacterium]
MDNSTIIEKIEIAIDALLSNDSWLLEKDLSERSITHKLAEYIQPLFLDHNVDCEYNGDADRDNGDADHLGRKRVGIITSQLAGLGLLTKRESQDETDQEFLERLVYPDIIIHKRGTNKKNLCIIEVKKSTSTVPYTYDRLKLCAYTTNQYGNLNYQLGVFVKLVTRTTHVDYDLKTFENGTGPELG